MKHNTAQLPGPNPHCRYTYLKINCIYNLDRPQTLFNLHILKLMGTYQIRNLQARSCLRYNFYLTPALQLSMTKICHKTTGLDLTSPSPPKFSRWWWLTSRWLPDWKLSAQMFQSGFCAHYSSETAVVKLYYGPFRSIRQWTGFWFCWRWGTPYMSCQQITGLST